MLIHSSHFLWVLKIENFIFCVSKLKYNLVIGKFDSDLWKKMVDIATRLTHEEISWLPTHKYTRKNSKNHVEVREKKKEKVSVLYDGFFPHFTNQPTERQNYKRTVYEEGGEEVVKEEWVEVRMLSRSLMNLNDPQLTTCDIDSTKRKPSLPQQKSKALSFLSKFGKKFKKPDTSKQNLYRSSHALNDLSDDLSSCSICLADFQEGEDVRRLPCLHAFHSDCIDSWLKVYVF